jgi:hypothetical protein
MTKKLFTEIMLVIIVLVGAVRLKIIDRNIINRQTYFDGS